MNLDLMNGFFKEHEMLLCLVILDDSLVSIGMSTCF